jgi:hypothetical protein
MVGVLAIGPKVRGFKSGRRRWIFESNKIRSTPSYGGKVKPSTLFCKILWLVKEPFKV